MRLTTILLALLIMSAFAANSILCRQALMTDSIGPIAFTFLRFASGMLILTPILFLQKTRGNLNHSGSVNSREMLTISRSSLWPAIALFCYATFFSLAYVKLDAGVGALILFASVQITMMGVSILQGNRVTPVEWVGLLISFSGLVYLLAPGLTAPSLTGTILMAASGASWGMYSLLGKREKLPIAATARNFLLCLPGIVTLFILMVLGPTGSGHIATSRQGVVLAVFSGAITSGLGYILWYVTVRRITTTQASVSQLVVPIFAAVGSIALLGESMNFRLLIASILIIGGIVVTIAGRSRHPQVSESGLVAKTASGQ